MDTKTKKEPKKAAKRTPKQALAKIGSLLKGIDNSVVAINKHKAIVTDAVKEVRSLMGGLSNLQAVKPAAKPAAKKAEKKPAEKKPKPAAKKAEKKPKPAAKKAEKKPKPAAKKAEKAPVKAKTEMKEPIEGRPLLKDAVKQIMVRGGQMTAADIWKQATERWGYWSRQSLYNVLKDEKLFSRSGDHFSLQNSSVDDVEAEKFVKQVESNQAVSSVQ